MQRPDTILPVKEGILKLVQTPKKGLYYIIGVDKSRKPFLWLKATDFVEAEERLLKAEATAGYQEGRVFYNVNRARPVFCADKAPTQAFTTWMLALCKEAGSEKLKTATYVKVPTSRYSAIVTQGTDCGVEEATGPGITDEAAEGVGAMVEMSEQEAQAHEEELRKLGVARQTHRLLSARLKEDAAQLKHLEGFREAVLAASEAGVLLRGAQPRYAPVQALLTTAFLQLKKASQLHAEQGRVGGKQQPSQNQPSLEPSQSPPPPVEDDEGEDEEEDEQGGSTTSTSQGYDAATGQYKGRPKKPKGLSGKDDKGNPLTAHHIYPWNKLRSDLNAALLDPTGDQMKKVLAFAVHTPPPELYEELAKQASARKPAFVEWVNAAARALCWGPSNIFMGPLNTLRGDDPGSKLDAAFSKRGLPTPASALGELVDRDGGIAKASALTEMLARNVRDAHTSETGNRTATGYDALEWEEDKDGKLVRRRGVPLEQEVIQKREDDKDVEVVRLRSQEDPSWDPSKKVAKEASLQQGKSQEEIQRLREEAEERRRLKEQQPKVDKDDEEEPPPDLDSLFN